MNSRGYTGRNNAAALMATLCHLASGIALAAPQSGIQDLSSLSLEDLLKVEVSSVSRHDQQLRRTPAAAFVITREDIRRSGANSIPEILRMVPGLQVARVSSSQWAVSSRGFNGRLSNKILVLIDGRSVYNDVYSGVFWEQNDVMLEDVERIEVIRGPGATMWGANAVNGVINVITKKARDTQGGLVTAETGQRDKASMAVRYGGEHGENRQYRAFTKVFDRDPLQRADGSPGGDGWNALRGGGRLDWQPDSASTVSFQGDLYRGNGQQNLSTDTGSVVPIHSKPDSVSFSGGFALGRWERNLTHGDIAVQAYYNRESREEGFGAGTLHTGDLDFQYHLPAGQYNDLMFGAGYRLRADRLAAGVSLFGHRSYDDHFSSTFLQDDITLIRDRLVLSAGVKLEHNSYTGLETQPGLRMLWTPSRAHSFWASAARAVRMPSIQELDVRVYAAMPNPTPIPLPAMLSYSGNSGFRSEVLRAYEAGYRRQLSPRLSVDVATFVNHYSDLASREQEAPYVTMQPSPALVFPLTVGNSLRGTSTGVETSMAWTPLRTWHLQASHSWLSGTFRYHNQDPAGTPIDLDPIQSPRNTVNIRSGWDVSRFWTFDTELRYISRIAFPNVPRYVSANLRVARKFGESGELSAGVDDLLRPRHLEFVPTIDYVVPTQVRRSAYVKMKWSF